MQYQRTAVLLAVLLGLPLTHTAQGTAGQPAGPADQRAPTRFTGPPTWTKTDKFFSTGGHELDYFGSATTLFGDLAVVSAPGHESTPYFAAGAAYLFTRDLGGRWTQLLELSSGMPNNFGAFGTSLDMVDGIIAVGAPGSDPACPGLLNCNSGTVTIFERDVAGAWNQLPELFPSDAAKLDRFGFRVSLGTDLLAVGAWGEGNNGPVIGSGNGHGAVYLFRRTAPSTWVEVQKLVPPQPQASQRFGSSVSLDGTTLIVGAPHDVLATSAGSVYVYRESGGVFVHEETLRPTSSASGDNFGQDVDLEGDTFVAGAPGASAAYVFERNSMGIWQERLALSGPRAFARTVELSGDQIAVGVPFSPTSTTGGVWMYRKDATNGWQLEQKLAGPTELGNSGLALENGVLLAGDATDHGDGTDRDRGATYSYQFDFAQPNPNVDGVSQVLLPGGVALTGVLGTSLAVFGDDLLAVATLNQSARIFERRPKRWVEVAELPPTATASTSFGSSIAISPTVVAIGDMAHQDRGVVNIFEKAGGSWNFVAEVIGHDVTTAPPFTPKDSFGKSVAIDGNTMIVGAMGKDAAYVFERIGGNWVETQKLEPPASNRDQYGWAVAIDGNLAAVSAWRSDEYFPDSGSVYTYERVNGVWVAREKLLPLNGSTTARFGGSLDLDGGQLIVGARLDDVSATNSGSAYVFQRIGGTWSQEARLLPLDPASGDIFGTSVALLGDTALIGANHSDTAGFRAGAVYYFHRDAGQWRQTLKVVANDTESEDFFGTEVALTSRGGLVSAEGGVYVVADPGPFPAPLLDFDPRFVSPDGLFGWKVGRGQLGNPVSLFLVAIDGTPVFVPVGLAGSYMDLSGAMQAVGTFNTLGQWSVDALAPAIAPGRLTFRAIATGHSGSQVSSNDVTLVFE